MIKKNIELELLVFILIDAFILLFAFKMRFLNYLVGSILGIIINVLTRKIQVNRMLYYLLLIASFLLLIWTIPMIISFITNNLLRNFSSFLITFSFLLVILYLVKGGYHHLTKALELTMYFFLLLKLLSFILVIPNMHLDYINFNYNDMFTFNLDFLYITFFIIYLNWSMKILSHKVVSPLIYIIGLINPLILKITCFLVMGKNLTYRYQYPYFNVLKRISYYDFIERMEGIFSFAYLFSFFFFSAYIILFINNFLIHKKNHIAMIIL